MRVLRPGRLAAAALLVFVTLTSPARASGPPAPFVDDSVLFQQKTLGYSCFRIPAVVRATNGTVLAFAEGRVADCGDDGDIDLVLRRSTDDGRTWGPLQVVSKGNGSTHGNPVPIVDNRTGRIVLLSTHNGPDPCTNGCDRDPYVQTSDDFGATWTAPRELTEAKRPEWNFWYATGPMHGIQLQHGAHAGRLIAGAAFESNDGTTHTYYTGLLYSDDSGQTWHVGATDSHSDGKLMGGEVTVAELNGGRVYADARESGTDPGNRAYAISSDGGDTFDAPFRTQPRLVTPNVQGALLRFRSTEDGDGRNRLLFSSPAHPAAREVMTVRSSYDQGMSWDTWDHGGKVFWWGPSAYSDLVKLGGDQAALLYEAGVSSPYESIRYARFDEAYLSVPNGTPPGIPGPPAPGPQTPDVGPAHNPAYVRGGATVAEGKFGTGLALDGVDDYVEVPFDRSIDLGADDFTMMTWIKYGATTGSRAILWAYRTGSGSTPQVWLRAEPESNRIRALLSVDRFNVTVQSASAYNDNQWHHVVLQRTNGKLRLLVDGTEVGSTTAPAGSVTAGKEFGVQGIHVGQRVDGANRFQGNVDEVRIYRRALTDAELGQIRLTNKPDNNRLGLDLPF
ncbi:exo-alpha-sialidase [Kribbella sp. WER1]